MTWVVASAHGLMVPLCQIHSGYCMSATRDGRPIILPDGRWRAAHRIYSTIHQHPMWRRRPNVVREGVEPLDSVCSTRSAKIGRASCRERVCQYVSISVVAGSLKKNTRILIKKNNNKPR